MTPKPDSYFPEHVSKQTSRVYGFVGVALGAGLIWLVRAPRWSARGAAIDDYVWRLSQELARRFGVQKYYDLADVTRVAKETGFNMAFIAYAHAMFCSDSDFDAYYTALHVACTYDGLREVVSRRYFDGASDFNATSIVRMATPPREEEYNFHD